VGKTFLLLGVAGAAGTWARVGLSRGLQNLTGWSFPVGTLAANCLGCFLFGLLWLLVEEGRYLSEETRWLLTLGFLGAFTTFSTLAFDSGDAIRHGEWGLAIGNLLANNVLGLICVFAGFRLARAITT
jgi:CrcB protein